VSINNLTSILVTEYYEDTKPAIFIIRAFYGARRPYAYRCRVFRKDERDLYYSTFYLRVRLTRVIKLYIIYVSSGARRPDAYRSMV
jgi:hypothetical protein